MPPLQRLAAVLAACALALAPSAASARPFTVDDLLRQESFGTVAFDPAGRWLVIERRAPYETAASFDNDQHNATLTSRLWVVDLQAPGPARPLLQPDPGAGVVQGPFSPSGARLAVYRLRDHRWTLGLVTLATAKVRWLPLTPELSTDGRTLQWLSEDSLLVIDRPDGRPTWPLRLGHLSADVLPALWARTARGEGAHAVLGSGRERAARPRPNPRRLLRLDLRTGTQRVLATGELSDLELSPDHQHAALLEDGPDLQPTAGQALQGDFGLDTVQHRLSLVDLASGARTTPLPGADLLPHLLAWSRSGELLVFARKPGEPWTAGQLLRLAPDGAARPAAPTLAPVVDGRPTLVGAAWLGDDPLVLARPDASHRADWFRVTPAGPMNLTGRFAHPPASLAAVDVGGLQLLADGQAWRVAADGEALKLADRALPLRAPRSWSEDRVYAAPPGSVWITREEGAARTALWSGARGPGPVITLAGEDGQFVAGDPTGRALVFRHSDRLGRGALVLHQVGHPLVTIAKINPLPGVDPPHVHAIRHTGPGGRPLTSWLFLPPTATRTPPPLLVRAYSGNVYRAEPRDPPPVLGLATDVRVLTGHGYAVLLPSLPVPEPRGEPMAGLADRIQAVVDAAAADPALADAFDPHRVALWGHSFGGYTVMAAIAQSDRFKAAVSIAGEGDLAAIWGSFYPALRGAPEEGVWTAWTAGWVETAQGDMGGPPWADPARYTRNSPLFSAERIHTPLMLIHGEQDNIPITQSEAMFSALYRQDRDALLVTYFGEGHHISSPGNVRDLYARAFAFLDARLGAPPRPAPAGAGRRSSGAAPAR